MKTYERVFPRDLFNEAKLLKCIGQLTLLAHDKNLDIDFVCDEYDLYDGFCINQNEDDGSLYVKNYNLLIKGENYHICNPYNSRANYPLLISLGDEEINVFDELGNFSEEFQTNFLK
jgi:hypothetical protein